jgi:DNA-binding transcriptional regulator GbsR (MarR family)
MKSDEERARAGDEFIDTMGRHFEEEGVPLIAGRLFGLLMLGDAPCSLDELTERLQVSKGSVSSNARLLENWGVAVRVSRAGDRRDFYRIAPDLSDRLIQRQIGRLELFIERLGRARAELAPLSPPVAARFDESARFNRAAIRSLVGLREELERTGGAGE